MNKKLERFGSPSGPEGRPRKISGGPTSICTWSSHYPGSSRQGLSISSETTAWSTLADEGSLAKWFCDIFAAPSPRFAFPLASSSESRLFGLGELTYEPAPAKFSLVDLKRVWNSCKSQRRWWKNEMFVQKHCLFKYSVHMIYTVSRCYYFLPPSVHISHPPFWKSGL